MLTVGQFIDSCAHETKIINHLATKLPPDQLEYRPTEGQRSMIELMRYLPRMVLPVLAYLEDGNWDRAPSFGEGVESITPDTFAAEMDTQLAEVRRVAGTLEGRLDEKTAMPWGVPCTVGQFLVDAVLKTFVAYRMQYFLYVKASGRPDIGPAQCWMGIDP
ncbi:MAG: hypothetical protein AAGD14_12130 [Planctomycetota bacterium]